MEAFLVSLTTVGLAEIGDRTQLLALMLAAHYRRPWSVLAGVLCASLLNNAIAAVIGQRVAHLLTRTLLDVIVGASLIGMALWALKSDPMPQIGGSARRNSAFVATAVAFFLAELGDKTQIAALTLAAGYSNLGAVIVGTTCAMVLTNVPAVFVGHVAAERLPLKAIHYFSSVLFLVLGVIFLVRAL
jgi:Ca2+/H+ antiporter, TMEM165/GDT1 family